MSRASRGELTQEERDQEHAAELGRRSGDTRAKRSMRIARNPLLSYCGLVRQPLHPDEHGAVNVIELVFDGGRIAFFRLDADQAEVRSLPASYEAQQKRSA